MKSLGIELLIINLLKMSISLTKKKLINKGVVVKKNKKLII